MTLPMKKPKLDRTKLALVLVQASAVLTTTLMYVGFDAKLPRLLGD